MDLRMFIDLFQEIVATAYFREKGMIPVFEDAICKLIKL